MRRKGDQDEEEGRQGCGGRETKVRRGGDKDKKGER